MLRFVNNGTSLKSSPSRHSHPSSSKDMKLIVLLIVTAMVLTAFAVKPRTQPINGNNGNNGNNNGRYDYQRGGGGSGGVQSGGRDDGCYDESHSHAPGAVHDDSRRAGQGSNGNFEEERFDEQGGDYRQGGRRQNGGSGWHGNHKHHGYRG